MHRDRIMLLLLFVGIVLVLGVLIGNWATNSVAPTAAQWAAVVVQ